MTMNSKYLIAALAATFSINAYPETFGPATLNVTTTTNVETTSSKPISTGNQSAQIANQYSEWAGSSTNAQSLVNGLRNGTPITLQPTALSDSPTNGVTFTAPTQPMGWGNVTKALSLARADLAAAGITNPTPPQLQTALTGGDIIVRQGTGTQTTHIDGILTMRNQGMGWGQIAHKLDLHPGTTFKSGHIDSRVQGLTDDHTQSLKENQTTGTKRHEAQHLLSANGNAVGRSGRTIAATGKLNPVNQTATHDLGHATAQSTHINHAYASRIVSASGAPIAASVSYQYENHGSGNINAQSANHITTASGDNVMAGGGNGGSNGKSLGHGKN